MRVGDTCQQCGEVLDSNYFFEVHKWTMHIDGKLWDETKYFCNHICLREFLE